MLKTSSGRPPRAAQSYRTPLSAWPPVESPPRSFLGSNQCCLRFLGPRPSRRSDPRPPVPPGPALENEESARSEKGCVLVARLLERTHRSVVGTALRQEARHTR